MATRTSWLLVLGLLMGLLASCNMDQHKEQQDSGSTGTTVSGALVPVCQTCGRQVTATAAPAATTAASPPLFQPLAGKEWGFFPLLGAAQPAAAATAIPLPVPTATSLPTVTAAPVVAAAAATPAAIATADPQVLGSCQDIVVRDDLSYKLNGQPYTFVGINVEYLLDSALPIGEDEKILASLAQNGVRVVRIWNFPDKEDGRFARVLDLGKKYGIRFIVALDNYYFDKDEGWFQGGFKGKYLDHVVNTVKKYRTRPEVLMWELMNEPNCSKEHNSASCLENIYQWAVTVSRMIHQIDPCHLITVGLSNGGSWSYDERDNFTKLSSIEWVGTVSLHKEVEKVLDKELEVSGVMARPVFYDELYYKAYDGRCDDLDGGKVLAQRAQAVAADLDRAAKDHRVWGYILWNYTIGAITGANGSAVTYCDEFGYKQNDPVFALFRARNGQLRP